MYIVGLLAVSCVQNLEIIRGHLYLLTYNVKLMD